jgi:hypothetical protein
VKEMIATGAITVRPAVSWRDHRRFQRLAWSIYAGDPNWVPPILAQERELMGWGHHPFFDNAEIVTLLAERDGRVVGRLAALTTRYKPAVLAALESSKLAIRPFDPGNYRQQTATYLDIYNRSLEGTWGFTPLQPREARRIADELRHVIVPQLAVFAEIGGQPVGAVLALLDYNQILRKLNGRLFPFGFVRLLTGRRHITAARVMAVTMVPGYQSAGLGIVLLDNLVGAVAEWGIERYEFSWVLESNVRSRGTLERAKTKITSTYRIYDKML